MSTIKQFQAIATNFFKQAIKTYSLQSLTSHRKITQKNLYQKLSQYPGGGVNFKIYRKTWPKGMHCIVTDVDYKSSRTGNIYGRMYNRVGRAEKSIPLRVRNGSKRSVWRYEVPEEGEIVLDNGMVYTMKEIKEVYEERRKSEIEAKRKAGEAEKAGEAGVIEEAEKGEKEE